MTATTGRHSRFFNDGGVSVEEIELRGGQSLIRWKDPETGQWTRPVWVRTDTILEMGCEVAVAESYARKYPDGIPIKPFDYVAL